MTRRGETKEYFVGDASFRRDHVEMTGPFDDEGLIEDWDVVEAIWEHTLRKRLVVHPDEHPVLLGEPAHATREQREKMVERMFETHSPPAVFLAKNPVLTAFASGRATALVVDCGAGARLFPRCTTGTRCGSRRPAPNSAATPSPTSCSSIWRRPSTRR